jgi:hypothetical protein
LGTKGKFWLNEPPSRTYLGGDFRRKRLTLGLGLVHYMSSTTTIEIGYRAQFYELRDERTSIDNWNQAPNLFFVGGRINW